MRSLDESTGGSSPAWIFGASGRLFSAAPAVFAFPLPHHGASAQRPKSATVWRRSEMDLRLCLRVAAVIATVSTFGYTAHILRVAATDRVNLKIERTHTVVVKKTALSSEGAAKALMIATRPAACVTSRSTAFSNSTMRHTVCSRNECTEAIRAANGVSYEQDNPRVEPFRYSQR